MSRISTPSSDDDDDDDVVVDGKSSSSNSKTKAKKGKSEKRNDDDDDDDDDDDSSDTLTLAQHTPSGNSELPLATADDNEESFNGLACLNEKRECRTRAPRGRLHHYSLPWCHLVRWSRCNW